MPVFRGGDQNRIDVGSCQQLTKIDQLGNATDYFYDARGRLTDVWLPAVDDGTTEAVDPARPGQRASTHYVRGWEHLWVKWTPHP